MKKILLFIFLLTTNAYGGDWDFFQLNQKLFYKRTCFDLSQPTTINEMLLDSAINYTDSVKLYFLKKYHGGNNAACFESAFNSSASYYSINFPDKNDADSILIKGDTISIYQNHFSILNRVEFLFLKNAFLNQSWTLQSSQTGNLFPDLRITCISSQSETFLGIMDSVKTFSLHGFNGVNAVSSFYDTIQIKLSKNYGLLHFISFANLIIHTAGFTTIYTAQLIGFNDGILQQGFQAPVTTDFIHFHPGEVYLWKMELQDFSPPHQWTIDYYRDSITQVSMIGDTLHWIYDTQNLDHTGASYYTYNQTGTYVINNDFKDVFEAPTNSLAMGCVPFNRIGFCSSGGSIKTVIACNSIVIDSINGMSVLKRNFNKWGDVIDTASCITSQLADDTYTLAANTIQGITKVCYTSFADDCITLIGSVIGGNSTGITDLPLYINENQNLSNDLKIYPVPVRNELTIAMKNPGKNPMYKIFNASGEMIFCKPFISDKINVADLKTGLYFLLVTDGNKIYKEKFLKQD